MTSGMRRRPFDTLFGRMAVFATLVLFAVQAGWFAVLTIQRPRHDVDGYARGLSLIIQAAHNDITSGVNLPPILGVERVPVTALPVDLMLRYPKEGPMARLVGQLRMTLPSMTFIALETGDKLRLWILYPASTTWIVVPIDPPPMPPILIESIAMLVAAILLSLGAAWQMQRPLSRVAQVARRFGKGERPLLVDERGPREVRDLIEAVNQMMTRISQSEDEKALMLAGIAHDLKAPLTRMKLRASALEDERDRDHFGRDVDSLTHIVAQFLEFAGSEPSDGPDVSVERFLAEQFAADGSEEALFVHRFDAGPSFVLPRTLIDRLVTNVVDNALEHGEPPVEMATYARDGQWVLEIRDHGKGIPDDRIEEACKPFARLDSARSGDGHCGLGLAIVGRLARKHRGTVEIGNAPGGGLCVRIVLPKE